MKIFSIIVCIAVLIFATAGGMYFYQQQRIDELQEKNDELMKALEAAKAIDSSTDQNEQTDPTSYTSEKGVAILVTAPATGSTVKSPLTVTGSVPGSWSHEGRFMVRLIGEDGGIVAEQPATLSGDWMTESKVPFTAKLTFTAPESTVGSLVLVKANPSDLPENSDSLIIPVQF